MSDTFALTSIAIIGTLMSFPYPLFFLSKCEQSILLSHSSGGRYHVHYFTISMTNISNCGCVWSYKVVLVRLGIFDTTANSSGPYMVRSQVWWSQPTIFNGSL